MPRQPRNLTVGGIYHIVNRGVEKRRVFEKAQDYSRFILCLEFANDKNPLDLWPLLANAPVGSDPTIALAVGERLRKKRTKSRERIVDILAFALMPNHYHLIAKEITPGGISRFMQKLGGYTTYFNKQYNRVGSLFQSKYKSVPIKDNAQLHVVFAYVHTNPVELIEPGWKNFRVDNPKQAINFLEEKYIYSSWRDYIGMATFPMATQQNFFLDFFGGEQKCKKAVEDWIRYKAKNTQFDPETLE